MNLSNLFFFLFLFLSYTSPISATNTYFTACNKTIPCGKLTDITYPFYDGDTRPEYCGYPGFKLLCKNTTPQINISNQIYNLLGINTTSKLITVSSINNFNSTNACPGSLHSTTIDPQLFNFSTSDQNLTFYACNQTVTDLLLPTKCENLLPRFAFTYYMTAMMLASSNLGDVSGICQLIPFPILKSAEMKIDKVKNTVALVDAFEAGFELGYFAGATESSCIDCVRSGGACGFNFTSHNFVCYSLDPNSNSNSNHTSPNTGTVKTPPPGSPSPSEKHHISAIPIILGASIGGGVLFGIICMLGAWCVFVQRRKKLRIGQEKVSGYAISSSLANTGIPVMVQGINGPSSSQYYTSTSTDSRSGSSYESSTPGAYFGVPIFYYSELQHATQNFDESRELGSGGYGRVYYGELQDGRQVAVKRLFEKSFRRTEQFMNEIEIFARLRHKNLVTLYGCTSTKSRVLVLVYEYVPNGTVADHLHGKHAQTAFLEWPVRLNIAVETAEALAYLHKSDVIHRDVKTTNILLDSEFHVKVADFGLSRLFPNEATHVSTYPQGTPGYVDPEYYTCFRLTEKSDVYSFGVILIEIISSMEAVDQSRSSSHVNLASMALDRIQNRALHELVDKRLGFERDHEVERMVKMVAELGFRCLQPEKDMRPTMEEVVIALRGIQMVGAGSIKEEGCGDDVVLLNRITT